MTANKNKLIRDATIVDVLQRFKDGVIDLQDAALELMRLKERIGLPIDEDTLHYLENRISLQHIVLRDIRFDRMCYGEVKLTLVFSVYEDDIEKIVFPLSIQSKF